MREGRPGPVHIDLPLDAQLATAQTAELMDALLAQGAGDCDHSALATLYERLSGLETPALAR